MPSIRDVVQTLATREGVVAVILLGRDGLIIDSNTGDDLDPDGVAAQVPALVAACGQLGEAAERGAFGVGLVEFDAGLVVVAELTPDALLALLFAPGTNVGSLLFELRQHRESIASLL